MSNEDRTSGHGHDVGTGLAMEGDRQWRHLQSVGKVHANDCVTRGGDNFDCIRCRNEAMLRVAKFN